MECCINCGRDCRNELCWRCRGAQTDHSEEKLRRGLSTKDKYTEMENEIDDSLPFAEEYGNYHGDSVRDDI